MLCGLLHIIDYRGKPTRLAPIPKPAPERALTAIAGTYVSKMLKVAAAHNAIRATSSRLRVRFLSGTKKAASATIIPSTKYFIALLINSLMLSPFIKLIL